MSETFPGQIKRPKFGQPVWMFVNGEPALRYFVRMDAPGCVVAFERSGCSKFNRDTLQRNVGYYADQPVFFKTEAHVLLRYIHGIECRLTSLAEELGKRRAQLAEALK